jgi:hypothetical protein
MSNYYLCDFFKKFIDNKKIEESEEIDNDLYIIHVKRYAVGHFYVVICCYRSC